ncbi:hypothetical protein F7234_23120 [Pseudomonas putida]|uniref:hypothetical protein n=1 Tax=Pseudomonas putida TaxID=303 RepID=UPI00125F0EF3|nr:hypothetical protein [Pseudomonas putida]KAB5618674.1 hypothetical protein F7234_23120 [Pseudomonas putida]
MTKNNQDIALNQLMENAIDFLVQSINDLKDKPKYSAIHFHAAIELILKARLMKEHWSLVVSPRKDPDLNEFNSGNFVSISLDESINRINKILPPGLTKPQTDAFRAITKHRNRMVHFFHASENEQENAGKIREIVKIQMTAWYYLHILMLKQWSDTFQPWKEQIRDLDKRLRGHLFYLQAVFENVQPLITEGIKRGWAYTTYTSCTFSAREHSGGIDEVYQSNCLVCELTQNCIQIACSKCARPVLFQGEPSAICPACSCIHDKDDLLEKFIDDGAAYLAVKDGGDYPFPINCGSCGAFETVVEISEDSYLCTECFDNTDSYGACEYCSDETTYLDSDTYYSGCGYCDGYAARYADD